MQFDVAGREYRRARRLPVSIDATLAGRQRYRVTVLDLSQTGCMVRCPQRLMPGAVLDLHMRLEGRPFTAWVQVAESAIEGQSLDTGGQPTSLVGLSFLGLPVDEQQRLQGLLPR